MLAEGVATPVADAETTESLIAAATSVEAAAEPPTVIMLAPTVVALVLKQPLAVQPETAQPEPVALEPEPCALRPEPEPVAEPEPLPSILDVGPSVLLPEQVRDRDRARSFDLLRPP